MAPHLLHLRVGSFCAGHACWFAGQLLAAAHFGKQNSTHNYDAAWRSYGSALVCPTSAFILALLLLLRPLVLLLLLPPSPLCS
jgi:hypothetical protein